MKVLIAFTTTEGQTRKIARHAAETITRLGHEAEVYSCDDDSSAPAVATFDAVILAGSVHQKRYQAALYDFVAANLAALQSKPTAFISVSLSITFTDGEAEAQSYYDNFAKETGWQASAVHLAEGAIRYTEYDFFKILTIKHKVFKGKKEMPEKTGNPEFTDWVALDDFVSVFLEDARQMAREVASS
ncbi:MAG: flavodoxin domain-containing protein [Hyphomicrobiaceae bacterium]